MLLKLENNSLLMEVLVFSNILKKILPAEDTSFYKLFDESISIAHESSLFLLKIIEEKQIKNTREELIENVKKMRAKNSEVTKNILQKLSSSFVTPLDGENIQNIAILIGKITKKNVRLIKRLLTYNLTEKHQLSRWIEFIVNATEELKTAISHLSQKNNISLFTRSNLKIKQIETQEDTLLYEAWDKLFSGDYDTLTVLKMNSIYRSIESVLETTFNVSDFLLNIVLKYS